ncbi:hypothetical protein GCK32_011771 [Trichostrongylus colubriformis]|uniref:Uncharacterized protein n=1 Tax=Trichostrongylus colubriformis TaxID=6319 RepID=A0AAN8FIJ9_TRICO
MCVVPLSNDYACNVSFRINGDGILRSANGTISAAAAVGDAETEVHRAGTHSDWTMLGCLFRGLSPAE